MPERFRKSSRVMLLRDFMGVSLIIDIVQRGDLLADGVHGLRNVAHPIQANQPDVELLVA
jgi:hypothetical protein